MQIPSANAIQETFLSNHGWKMIQWKTQKERAVIHTRSRACAQTPGSMHLREETSVRPLNKQHTRINMKQQQLNTQICCSALLPRVSFSVLKTVTERQEPGYYQVWSRYMTAILTRRHCTEAWLSAKDSSVRTKLWGKKWENILSSGFTAKQMHVMVSVCPLWPSSIASMTVVRDEPRAASQITRVPRWWVG